MTGWAEELIKFNDSLEFLASTWYEAYTHTTEMKKLEAGFLIKEILDRFTNKTMNRLKPNRKLWIYSTHDLTIANVLNSLNLFDVMYSFRLILTILLKIFK